MPNLVGSNIEITSSDVVVDAVDGRIRGGLVALPRNRANHDTIICPLRPDVTSHPPCVSGTLVHAHNFLVRAFVEEVEIFWDTCNSGYRIPRIDSSPVQIGQAFVTVSTQRRIRTEAIYKAEYIAGWLAETANKVAF
ncbi:hypothetical protein PMIN03_006485 [Paraphaeosphaeria minitans]